MNQIIFIGLIFCIISFILDCAITFSRLYTDKWFEDTVLTDEEKEFWKIKKYR